MAWKPVYADHDDLRAYLTVPRQDEETPTVGDIAVDANMDLALGAASRIIDRETNRQFGSTDAGESPDPETRYYTATYLPARQRYVVVVDDIMDTADLAVVIDSAEPEFLPLPFNAAQEGRPYTELEFTGTVSVVRFAVAVTAHFGWTEIPDDVKTATMMQAHRLFKRKEAPFGVLGSVDWSSEVKLTAKTDPDVRAMLADYKRRWGAV